MKRKKIITGVVLGGLLLYGTLCFLNEKEEKSKEKESIRQFISVTEVPATQSPTVEGKPTMTVAPTVTSEIMITEKPIVTSEVSVTSEPMETPGVTICPQPTSVVVVTPEPTPTLKVTATLLPTPTPEPTMPEESTTAEVDPKAFIRVDGVKLVDGNEEEFRIKGMCFGNNVWAKPSEPVVTHHDEKSYAELAELGFNTVRFYMNYNLFEEDDAPYEYKESGFDWLDQNIVWAKKHGIKLILNMHVPQGGFLSASDVSFWKKSWNAKRYKALWCEIAERYAEEPTILGYGLMNEPFLPKQRTYDDALQLYYGLMEELTKEIREVDPYHVFFVERPYGVVDDAGKVEYPWGDVGACRVLEDENVVYEFHFYEKTQFTAQGISWKKQERDWYYEDDRVVMFSGTRSYPGNIYKTSTQSYQMWTGGWQYMESPLLDLNEYPEVNAAYALAVFSNMSERTVVYLDDIVVEEYDENGKKIRTLASFPFNINTTYRSWQTGEKQTGKCVHLDNEGHYADGCEMILGVNGTFCLNKSGSEYEYFPVTEGNKYKVSFWVKIIGPDQVIVKPGMQLVVADKMDYLNKDYLENKLLPFINWGKEHEVPIYIGEFGTSSYIMGNKYGGEKWISDVMDIFSEYRLHYSYHDYHEEAYGLYTTAPTKERGKRNQVLYRLFKEKVKE